MHIISIASLRTLQWTVHKKMWWLPCPIVRAAWAGSLYWMPTVMAPLQVLFCWNETGHMLLLHTHCLPAQTRWHSSAICCAIQPDAVAASLSFSSFVYMLLKHNGADNVHDFCRPDRLFIPSMQIICWHWIRIRVWLARTLSLQTAVWRVYNCCLF